jgi:hypothetical protein
MSGEGPRHTVADVSHESGRLTFTARVGDREAEIWFTADGGATSDMGVLPSCLVPAMALGGTLELPVAISPRVMRTQLEFQAILRAWSQGWEHGAPLREVEVVAPTRRPPQAAGRVAAFFSNGVDSWSTLIEHEEITDLVFMHGFDLLLENEHHRALGPVVEERVREVADELGKTLHVVETNLRLFSDPLAGWENNFVSAMAAVAHFLSPRFERVYMASGLDHEAQVRVGLNRLISQLWSTEELEVVEDGGRFSRVERTARAAAHPLARRTLRVCWENPGGAYNCGSCRKCLMTMITLEALGMLDRVETFPDELPLESLAAIEVNQHATLSLWEDVLDEVRAAGREDLEAAIEPRVQEAKPILGLPADHRGRSRPGPPPVRPGPRQDQDDGSRPLTLDGVLSSRSWRLTKPLRSAGAWARRLRR